MSSTSGMMPTEIERIEAARELGHAVGDEVQCRCVIRSDPSKKWNSAFATGLLPFTFW